MLNWQEDQRAPVNDARTHHRVAHLAQLGLNVESHWFSVLLKLEDTSIDTFLTSLPAQIQDLVHVPSLYSAADRAAEVSVQYVSGFAKFDALHVLNQEDNPHGVSAVRLGGLAEHGIDPSAEFEPISEVAVDEETVTMAVIDDAIALGHELFSESDCLTRIKSALVMGAANSASGNTRGQKFSQSELNALLAQCTTAGLLDEEKFYRLTGQIDASSTTSSPLAKNRSHGTHVTALAAGYPRGKAPSTRPLICAMLPAQVTRDVSGHSLLPDLIYALKFVSAQSKRIKYQGTPAPVVCNFSYGSYGGPHDGTGDVEQVLEKFVSNKAQQIRRVVLPSGNSYNKDIHACLDFDGIGAQTQSVGLDVSPVDRSASHVQFWLPVSKKRKPSGDPTVEVTLPSGLKSPPFVAKPNSTLILRNKLNQPVAQLSYAYERKPTQRGVITLTIYPTSSFDKSEPLAGAGIWNVDVTYSDQAKIYAWIDRDEDLPGYRPRGRQMRFVSGPNSGVSDLRTLNGFACGESPIVVGAINQQEHAMSDYSASGPITKTPNSPSTERLGPDAAAIGDDSSVRTGVFSAGSRNGSFVRMSGTSVASPQIARVVADALEAGQPATRAWVQAKAKSENPEIDREKLPLERAGEGPICVEIPFAHNQ